MGPWGGYQNGRIPLAAMEYVGRGAINGEPQYLNPAAAAAWRGFVADVLRETGILLVITEGFRPLALQQHYWNTLPFPLAATPGTSTHGWALAVDMANYARVDKALLRRLAQARGFSFATGDRVREPWHIEFIGSLTTWAGSNGTPLPAEKEDDMFSDADRKLLQGSRPIRELILGPDGTVWYCYERILRYAIPAEANLATYRAHLRNLGYDDAVQSKNAAALAAYGTPVYAEGARIIPASVKAIGDASKGESAAPANIDGIVAELKKAIPTAEQNGAAARAAIVK